MVQYIILISGLALLITGAQFTVTSASRLAASFGVPPLVIGMTLVAFGTGVPELVLNLLSAWNGSTSLAFGNLVGASTINISFVLGLVAIIQPLTVRRSIVTREIPLMILASIALLALSSDALLGGHFPLNVIDRADGIVLLLFFSVFLYYTIIELASQTSKDSFVESVRAEEPPSDSPNNRSSVLTLALGLAAVTFGARMTVDGASAIAVTWGISESIVGLTILSFGTTLPELVTCITAARRGSHDLALGNLVGSNILNLLLFFGIVSVVHPIPLPAYGLYDLTVLFTFCSVLAPIALRGPLKITRAEGMFLTCAYVMTLAVRLIFLR